MNKIPPKKDKIPTQFPVFPISTERVSIDFARISTKEMYTITPAENPNATDNKRVLVFLAKKAMAPPTPVERPANNVNINAKNRVPIVNTIVITALLDYLSNQ